MPGTKDEGKEQGKKDKFKGMWDKGRGTRDEGQDEGPNTRD
jgi:hypothetical protein